MPVAQTGDAFLCVVSITIYIYIGILYCGSTYTKSSRGISIKHLQSCIYIYISACYGYYKCAWSIKCVTLYCLQSHRITLKTILLLYYIRLMPWKSWRHLYFNPIGIRARLSIYNIYTHIIYTMRRTFCVNRDIIYGRIFKALGV